MLIRKIEKLQTSRLKRRNKVDSFGRTFPIPSRDSFQTGNRRSLAIRQCHAPDAGLAYSCVVQKLSG
jgi:hypothetical protein